MMTAQPQPDLDTLLTGLIQQAAALAEARTREAALAQTQDPSRWRDASLLWPTFAGGQKG